MANSQILVWTALPTAISGDTLSLSVFLSPQLSGEPIGGESFVPLSAFPDFTDWPSTVGGSSPISFAVSFAPLGATAPTVTELAEIVTPTPPGGVSPSAAWTTMFDPKTTAVESFALPPFLIDPISGDTLTPAINSFWAAQVASFVSGLYGSIGASNPVDPIIITFLRDTVGADNPNPVYKLLLDLLDPAKVLATDNPDLITPTQAQALSDLANFHNLPNVYGGYDPTFKPTTPTLDFHQALSGLGSYPTILRLLNLVFDLTVALPSGLPEGIQVLVTPTLPSSAPPPLDNAVPPPAVETMLFTPWTAATLTASSFLPTPSGADYANGMLDLNDDTRFSVTDLDVEIAADRLHSQSATLVSTNAFETTPYNPNGDESQYRNASTALTVPALRSIGPTVLWSGYGTPLPGSSSPQSPFAALLAGQASLQQGLAAWLESPTIANLPPALRTEQIIRGHRFDVYTASEASPAWRGLCGRNGTYTFGPNSSSPIAFSVADEGVVTPAASQLAGTMDPPPPTLNVLETIVRWRGWGLCAPRPGNWVADDSNAIETDPSGSTAPPAPTSDGPNLPQLATSFQAPNPSTDPDLLFPKLRFGNSYELRARGVDLAGNSVSLSSTDASTAISFAHYRHEPVRPPVLAGIDAFTPGESTLYLVLLDDQVNPPTTNGRWLFPPKVSQLLAEEHGMFDGFTPGQAPNSADGPNGSETTYDTIVGYDGQNLGDITGAQYDTGNQGVPYFAGTPLPVTPWLPDPLSTAATLFGLPGLTDALTTGQWGGIWPVADPILLTLAAGATATSEYVAAATGSPASVATTLPPGEVAIVRISSALSRSALAALGVWQWIAAQPPGPGVGDVAALAAAGQVWLLSPFQVLRMVHAVRVPLLGPGFGSPQTTRFPGQTSVLISDPKFNVDEKSTGHVDVGAVWTDPYDNPADSDSDPALPPGVPPRTPPGSAPSGPTSTVTSSGPAFRLTIPDPTPTGPEAQPLTVLAEAQEFALGADGEGATHFIGDTLHHVVYYTATGSSRFADMFQTSEDATFTPTALSATISTAELGVNADTLAVTITDGPQLTADQYAYTAATRTVTVSSGLLPHPDSTLQTQITYQPTTTLAGAPDAVEVLSSARPKAPVISDVVPAWQIAGPSGALHGSGLEFVRTGGFLRVYLERPWFSTGAGELLGVVTTVPTPNDATETPPAWVTTMGLDPINYVEQSNTPWPIVPTLFTDLAAVPIVPGRPPYTNPPQVYLPEDENTLYRVWPYEVNYDSISGRWYADIAPRPGLTDEGTYEPPPGYFIRLALVRFQPYSELYDEATGYLPGSTVEVSPVVTATIAQPVPDRTVVVVARRGELRVTVSGPAYQGWRPAQPPWFSDPVGEQFDLNNIYAPPNPDVYDGTPSDAEGSMHTSTMVIEVQVQDAALNKLGLEGDFAWTNSGGDTPLLVSLAPSFSDASTVVTWRGRIALPDSLSSATKMRLRVSELDYYTGDAPPSSVDTSLRRPFVSLIPLN